MKTDSVATGDRGSMLIEALVAVAVMALVMAVGYRAIGESAKRVRASAASGEAMLIARSKMDSVGADIPLAAGETEGRERRFDWRVTVSPDESEESTTGALWRTKVVVSQGGVRRAGLDSLRLGPGA